jgi:alkylated DNA repair dioxygenase AlkB
MFDDFERHRLDGAHSFYTGNLPSRLRPDATAFDDLWRMHPDEYHEIRLVGRTVRTPRWEQAYGKDYEYTGQLHRSLPIPQSLSPFLSWARESIDARLNGLLVNWYDGKLGHYNGKHRDSLINITEGVPFIIISLGEECIFRLRPPGAGSKVDFRVSDGSVFILPYETNRTWMHEVPRYKRFLGRRISVTLRGFDRG